MKLYSDILKGKEMDHTKITMETVQGISVASGYGLNLIPRPPIKADKQWWTCNDETVTQTEFDRLESKGYLYLFKQIK